jgi:hypothetical protein
MLGAYQSYKAKQAEIPAAEKGDDAATSSSSKSRKKTSRESSADTKGAAGSGFFSDFWSRNFYDGGFEGKMTKREAALILGVRESASVERLKKAHRTVLLLNHPDRGGSPYVAAKINEAKDLLLKGRDH